MKKIARFIVELTLVIAIVTFVIVQILNTTILSKSYVFYALEKSDYYDQIYELLESNFENYMQQSGLQEDILKNIVTKYRIEKDTKSLISNIYDGIIEDINTDDMEKDLINKIYTENPSLSSEQKKSVEDFVKEISNEYKNTILSINKEKELHAGYDKIMDYIKLANKVLIILIGASIIILILLNLKRNYKIMTNIGTSLLASGGILLIANIYTNIKIKIQYITIMNTPVSEVVREVFTDILSKILKYGITFAIVGLIMIIISNLIHNKLKYSDEENEE